MNKDKYRLTLTQKAVAFCCVIVPLYFWASAFMSVAIDSLFLSAILTSVAGSFAGRLVIEPHNPEKDAYMKGVKIAFIFNTEAAIAAWSLTGKFSYFFWPVFIFIGIQVIFNQKEEAPIPG